MTVIRARILHASVTCTRRGVLPRQHASAIFAPMSTTSHLVVKLVTPNRANRSIPSGLTRREASHAPDSGTPCTVGPYWELRRQYRRILCHRGGISALCSDVPHH